MKQIVINVSDKQYNDLEYLRYRMGFDNEVFDMNSFYINLLNRGYNNCRGIIRKSACPQFSLYKGFTK